MKVLLPHQVLEQKVRSDFDRDVRRRFFRGLEFVAPQGDPGWFGPDSPVWYVHSHTSALIFGLQCAAFMERLDPSIFWMGSDHSRVAERDADGRPTGRFDLEGAQVRLGHSVAFFIGTAYGSTRTAEKLAQTVRAMHHTVKGVRPDGLPYDADDPDWLRWNYATVVWGIATAHQMYHPAPLRDIDRYYSEFVRLGHALGGTDLPRTKAETLDCLESYLPKLALTHGAALATGAALLENPDVPQAAKFFDWAMRDAMPRWAAELVMYRPPHPVERAARRAATWAAINGTQAAMGPLREFRQAQRRVAGGTVVEHTDPGYVAGSDPVRSRDLIEQAL
ncbi:MAG: DUF2236 domain-containing protein [Mycobacterium sp.]|nr:DUF2236 domain-containing protein [Mycobacterium sp.]